MWYLEKTQHFQEESKSPLSSPEMKASQASSTKSYEDDPKELLIKAFQVIIDNIAGR